MQCPNCETLNRDGAHFCDECGFPLDTAAARKVRTWEVDPTPEPQPEESVDDEEAVSNDDGVPLAEDPTAVQDPLMPSDDVYVHDSLYTNDAFDVTKPLDDNEVSWLDAPDVTVPVQVPPTPERGSRDIPVDATMEIPRVEQAQPNQNRDFRIVNDVPKRGGAKRVIIAIAIVAVIAAAIAGVTYMLGMWGGVFVPDVKGKVEAEAVAELTDAGFEVRTTQVKSDDLEGTVLITDPQGGSRVAEGSEVVVHVASMRTIPDIIGKPKEDAGKLLSDDGYDNVRYELVKSNEPEGIVASVNPEVGSRAPSSREVVVGVTEAYRVPSVIGFDLGSADEAIRAEELLPDVVYIYTDQYPDGTVIGTQPEAGTKMTSGEYVTLNVARARGIELEALTEGLLSKGSTITLGGVSYEIESVVSVSYIGNNTVAFTATGRPKITFFGETLYASTSQTISGHVVWSDNNEVISIS